MLFNSLDFAVFLPLVFVLYWLLARKSIKVQNVLLLVSSYVFYGWWDWRFLSLILFSSLLDFGIGKALLNTKKTRSRKALLGLSIGVNLGFLGLFKYYNFFLENFESAFSLFGFEISGARLDIILPVGISFYTFQTLSYTIDVYRNKMLPSRDLLSFLSYVSFFPQLVAGPIERASHLLPQFYKKRSFSYVSATDGMRQILWGFFKKVVIADNCAEYANRIFDHSQDHSGSTLILGAIFFTFQIYGDFSGYSDIAIGTSRLFGFDLQQNFAFPYFSRNIGEFWRRWHISLSSWFKDYLYIPLGGSRGSIYKKLRNTIIIFLVSGFWHGANWTFIVWGALNAVYFIPLLLSQKNRSYLDTVAAGRYFPSWREVLYMSGTFALTVFTWIFFRARDIEHALEYLSGIFSASLWTIPVFQKRDEALTTLILIVLFMTVEWVGRNGKYALEQLSTWFPGTRSRWTVYLVITIAIVILGNFNKTEFIYFAF